MGQEKIWYVAFHFNFHNFLIRLKFFNRRVLILDLHRTVSCSYLDSRIFLVLITSYLNGILLCIVLKFLEFFLITFSRHFKLLKTGQEDITISWIMSNITDKLILTKNINTSNDPKRMFDFITQNLKCTSSYSIWISILYNLQLATSN